MSLLDKAIADGIEDGMFIAFSDKIEEIGDCYHDPEDRCAMRPEDGCSCMFLRWSRLPWYKRIFTKQPKKPSTESVQKAAIRLLVEEAFSNVRVTEVGK